MECHSVLECTGRSEFKPWLFYFLVGTNPLKISEPLFFIYKMRS